MGSLIFAALGTQPDIAFSIVTLGLQVQLAAARRVLRYLAAARPKGLFYLANSKWHLVTLDEPQSENIWEGMSLLMRPHAFGRLLLPQAQRLDISLPQVPPGGHMSPADA